LLEKVDTEYLGSSGEIPSKRGAQVFKTFMQKKSPTAKATGDFLNAFED
jgi:hypothetical protein